ncbi:MAG: YraN family protein, partial [Flammeovirgaceae bacterium]|nr:YraN family protein [Flammeovirgaceae bacterium]MDW8288593.1 YraN family protein [Flammeovirgaceae bacterium]
QHAEIDLILRKNDLLVFVEVKYRTNVQYGYPETAVNKRKQQHLLKAVNFYLEQHRIESPIRCDIVAITEMADGIDVLHLEDAWGYDLT